MQTSKVQIRSKEPNATTVKAMRAADRGKGKRRKLEQIVPDQLPNSFSQSDREQAKRSLG
jgi:hypothetical protein